MAKIQPDYGYYVERNDTFVRYAVAGEGVGIFMTLVWIIFGLCLGLLPSMVLNNGIPSFILGFIAFIIVQLVSAQMKRPFWITISQDGVDLARGGKTQSFARQHISSLSLQNDAQRQVVYNSELQQGHLILVGSGIGGGIAAGFAVAGAGLNRVAHQTGKAVGQLAAAEKANRSWSIKILYGSKYVPLAKGLKQGTANALYNDLCQTLAQ